MQQPLVGLASLVHRRAQTQAAVRLADALAARLTALDLSSAESRDTRLPGGAAGAALAGAGSGPGNAPTVDPDIDAFDKAVEGLGGGEEGGSVDRRAVPPCIKVVARTLGHRRSTECGQQRGVLSVARGRAPTARMRALGVRSLQHWTHNVCLCSTPILCRPAGTPNHAIPTRAQEQHAGGRRLWYTLHYALTTR
jgi:hypothetical protein